MLPLLTPKQWREWKEYADVEPFGFPIEDLRQSILVSSVFNAQGAKIDPSAFMMERWDDDDEAEPDPKEFAKAFADAIGAVPVPVKKEN